MSARVQKVQQDGEPANPVDQGVMELEDQRGAPALQSLDDHCLPWWQDRVETDRAHVLGDAEHIGEGGPWGQQHAPQVEVEVEVRSFHELRSTAARKSAHAPRTQARHDLGEPIDPERSRSHAGGWSKPRTATTVWRRTGSLPIVQSSASDPLIVSVMVRPLVVTATPSPLSDGGGHGRRRG